MTTFNTIDDLQAALDSQNYIAERPLATSLFLALQLQRPIFLEGEPGVGKTEVAKVLATLLDTDLIRLQCYEGLDISSAVYEWNYARQMLQIRMNEASGDAVAAADLFSPEFLQQRPLLQAIDPSRDKAPVLLIDELDRSDEEFEAYLLELLSDFQITIPEIGQINAAHPPVVIVTSNRTREVHDALKRRCLYHWIEFPDFDKELTIVRMKVPDAPEDLAKQVTYFVQELREADLYKLPGVAETLDWLRALVALNQKSLDETIVQHTIGALLKYQDDVEQMTDTSVRQMVDRAKLMTK